MSDQKTPLKEQSSPVENRDYKALVWGWFSILVGVIVILATLILEETIRTESHIYAVTITLFEHMGVAAIVLGFVGIMIDFKHWQKYFQERLAETIIGRNYLKTLSKAQLISLQTDTLRTFFEVDEIDREESLLEYFHSKIQGFLGSPYREDTAAIVTLTFHEDGSSYSVEESISYKCRKVGLSIQNEVRWSMKSFIEELEEFSISLSVPHNFYQGPDFQSRYPNIPKGEITFEAMKDGSKLVAVDEGMGYTLSLVDFKEIDGLNVHVHARYRVRSGWPLAWSMTHPSKNLTLTVHYPKELKIEVDVFGMAENEYQEEDRQGLYVLRYSSWLLPTSGLYYHLNKRQQSPSPSPPTTETGAAKTNSAVAKSQEASSSMDKK